MHEHYRNPCWLPFFLVFQDSYDKSASRMAVLIQQEIRHSPLRSVSPFSASPWSKRKMKGEKESLISTLMWIYINTHARACHKLPPGSSLSHAVRQFLISSHVFISQEESWERVFNLSSSCHSSPPLPVLISWLFRHTTCTHRMYNQRCIPFIHEWAIAKIEHFHEHTEGWSTKLPRFFHRNETLNFWGERPEISFRFSLKNDSIRARAK